MAKPVFIRDAYATLVQYRDARVFQTRDGAAFSELAAALYGLDWTYGGLIYNYPKEFGIPSPGREAFAFLTEDHWLVLTTRPPMDDEPNQHFRFVRSSGSHLEQAGVFAELKRYFDMCRRGRILLTEAVGRGYDKADCQFRMTQDARLKKFKSLDKRHEDVAVPRGSKTDPYRTLAFFLRSSRIPEYNCGLIASFGMGGMETLIWNRIVRTRFEEWLTRDVFVVAELEIAPIPDRPITLDFINPDTVKARIVVEHTWPKPRASRKKARP